jgi:hypothetical protein
VIQVVNCRLPQEVRFTIVYIYKCSINKVFIIITIIIITIIIITIIIIIITIIIITITYIMLWLSSFLI